MPPKVSLQPPSGPPIASLLAELRLVYNSLIYLILSSIGPALFGREAKFLPALRETAGRRPWLLGRAATLAQAAALGRHNQRRCAVSDAATAATPEKSCSTAARARSRVMKTSRERRSSSGQSSSSIGGCATCWTKWTTTGP